MEREMQSSKFASLYVGNLSSDVTEEDLIHRFSLIVPVVSVQLCRNPITGEIMYAVINFDSHLTASKALTFLKHTELKGKDMQIMWCHLQNRRTSFGDIYRSIATSSFEQIVCPSRPLQSWGFDFTHKALVPNVAEFGIVKELLIGFGKEVYQFVGKKILKGDDNPFGNKEINPNTTPPPLNRIQHRKDSFLTQYLKRNSSDHRALIEYHFPKTFSVAEDAIRRN